LVASRRTFPANDAGFASRIAFSVPSHRVAITSSSPNAAASANVPAETVPSVASSQLRIFSA
jgi:hypothetical protein